MLLFQPLVAIIRLRLGPLVPLVLVGWVLAVTVETRHLIRQQWWLKGGLVGLEVLEKEGQLQAGLETLNILAVMVGRVLLLRVEVVGRLPELAVTGMLGLMAELVVRLLLVDMQAVMVAMVLMVLLVRLLVVPVVAAGNQVKQVALAKKVALF